jgi:uncharacterized protein YaaN involved in tellurite resistance
MNTNDLNIEARLQDLMTDLDNMTEDVSPSEVRNRIAKILTRAEDTRFELECRQADAWAS